MPGNGATLSLPFFTVALRVPKPLKTTRSRGWGRGQGEQRLQEPSCSLKLFFTTLRRSKQELFPSTLGEKEEVITHPQDSISEAYRCIITM